MSIWNLQNKPTVKASPVPHASDLYLARCECGNFPSRHEGQMSQGQADNTNHPETAGCSQSTVQAASMDSCSEKNTSKSGNNHEFCQHQLQRDEKNEQLVGHNPRGTWVNQSRGLGPGNSSFPATCLIKLCPSCRDLECEVDKNGNYVTVNYQGHYNAYGNPGYAANHLRKDSRVIPRPYKFSKQRNNGYGAKGQLPSGNELCHPIGNSTRNNDTLPRNTYLVRTPAGLCMDLQDMSEKSHSKLPDTSTIDNQFFRISKQNANSNLYDNFLSSKFPCTLSSSDVGSLSSKLPVHCHKRNLCSNKHTVWPKQNSFFKHTGQISCQNAFSENLSQPNLIRELCQHIKQGCSDPNLNFQSDFSENKAKSDGNAQNNQGRVGDKQQARFSQTKTTNNLRNRVSYGENASNLEAISKGQNQAKYKKMEKFLKPQLAGKPKRSLSALPVMDSPRSSWTMKNSVTVKTSGTSMRRNSRPPDPVTAKEEPPAFVACAGSFLTVLLIFAIITDFQTQFLLGKVAVAFTIIAMLFPFFQL